MHLPHHTPYFPPHYHHHHHHTPHIHIPRIHHPPFHHHHPPGKLPETPFEWAVTLVGLVVFAIFFFVAWLPGWNQTQRDHAQFRQQWEQQRQDLGNKWGPGPGGDPPPPPPFGPRP
jgi:hypothetical protein